MKNLLWYLIAGTKGGETRGRIIDLLNKTPSNANKIAEILKLDYKTVKVDNVESILLDPIVITKANLDLLIKENFYTKEQLGM